MPHRMWRPNVGGVRCTVAARWHPWTYDGELVLDTDIIKTWGTRRGGPNINFQIYGHHAFLRHNLTGFDLYVDEDKVPDIYEKGAPRGSRADPVSVH